MGSGSDTLTDAYPAVSYNNMPTTITANDPDARGSQSSNQENAHGSQASRQKPPEQQQPRTPVKEHIAAWESNIKKFGQDIKGPEMFNISQDGDVVISDSDSADWHQRSPSRSYTHKNHNKVSSEALSLARSGASQSLDGRKKDRDIAIAELKNRRGEAAYPTNGCQRGTFQEGTKFVAGNIGAIR
jgi:hypothetical protein